MCESTFQDFLNDTSTEEWAEWESNAAELELTVDYYVQEFVLLVPPEKPAQTSQTPASNPVILHSYLSKPPQMSVTLAVNYKEIFAAAVVEKIDELLEENNALECMLEFINENSVEDFVTYYEEYVEQGESLGYDVVDAFVKHHGDMSYVEYVRDAYRGVYNSEAEFTEEYYNDVYGEIPVMLVVDWEATWNSGMRYDFDFVDGFVFSSQF